MSTNMCIQSNPILADNTCIHLTSYIHFSSLVITPSKMWACWCWEVIMCDQHSASALCITISGESLPFFLENTLLYLPFQSFSFSLCLLSLFNNHHSMNHSYCAQLWSSCIWVLPSQGDRETVPACKAATQRSSQNKPASWFTACREPHF